MHLHLAEVAEEVGESFKEFKFKYGIFGAEPWSEEMREELEAKLHLSAVDIYGLSEVMGPGVAMECHEAKKASIYLKTILFLKSSILKQVKYCPT